MGKIRVTEYANRKEILKYDHFVAEAIVLTQANSTTVDGSLVIHGFIDKSKLPTEPDAAAITALPMIKFI